MSQALRVLYADDSVTIRRLLAEVLSNDSSLEVCRAACDGREAVTQFSLVHPDVVLLDVEMPVMDGIEAAIAIRQLDSQVPIIMFNSMTTRGGEGMLDALSNGATDYVLKPSHTGHLRDAVTHIRDILIPRIKHWGRSFQDNRLTVGSSTTAKTTLPVSRRPLVGARRGPITSTEWSIERAAPNATAPVDIVAIGVSTGGPSALAEVLRRLPKTFPVPILIAQHMPPKFTGLLASQLDQVCPLDVQECQDGAIIEPGQVWIACGGHHMVVEKRGNHHHVRTNHGPPENSCSPSADVLFRSVANTYRENALAVVMTGMGQDGLQGCRLIHERGGHVMAQDQASSVVWGMPRVVAEAGLADHVLPVNRIADELVRMSQVGRSARASVCS